MLGAPRATSQGLCGPRGHVRLAFIDADHDVASVLRDFAGIASLMRPGGCILFDDFESDFVQEGVNRIEAYAKEHGLGTVERGATTATFRMSNLPLTVPKAWFDYGLWGYASTHLSKNASYVATPSPK